jgi:hypothetical protein
LCGGVKQIDSVNLSLENKTAENAEFGDAGTVFSVSFRVFRVSSFVKLYSTGINYTFNATLKIEPE